MVSLVLLFIFFGFYLCYTTSKRMVAPHSFGIELWCRERIALAKTSGSLLLIISCSLSILHLGWGAGILTFSVLFMTLASLLILLQPIGVINYLTVGCVFSLCFISELLLF